MLSRVSDVRQRAVYIVFDTVLPQAWDQPGNQMRFTEASIGPETEGTDSVSGLRSMVL